MRPSQVDIQHAHPTLVSGDTPSIAHSVVSSRSPIGGPLAFVAPTDIVDTYGATCCAAAASYQARLALEAHVPGRAIPVFPLHNAPPAYLCVVRIAVSGACGPLFIGMFFYKVSSLVLY